MCFSLLLQSARVLPHTLLASLAGRDAPDVATTKLGKPEIAVRSSCDLIDDPTEAAVGCGERELGDAPCRRSMDDSRWRNVNMRRRCGLLAVLNLDICSEGPQSYPTERQDQRHQRHH